MLKDDVLVVFIAQQILTLCRLLCSLLGLRICIGGLCGLLFLSYGLFGGSVSLLLRRDLLQTVELLAVQLVQLRVDVLDRVLGAGDDDVLAGSASVIGGREVLRCIHLHGVDTAVDNLDDLVQDDEGGLQTGELDQRLDGAGICLSTPLDLLSTLA